MKSIQPVRFSSSTTTKGFSMIKVARNFVVLALLTVSAAFAADTRKGNYLQWGDSPEAYFMTAEERKAWKGVLSKEQAEIFITDYWAKRGEAFHNEVRARIQAADQHFGLNEKAGSMTEKGRVFMILGAPDRQTTVRQQVQGGGFGTGSGGPNSLERSAFTVTEWVYKTNRLPKDLNVPELTIRFQTDIARGYQTIENPGLIEPYLKRVVEYQIARRESGDAGPATTMTQGKQVGASAGVDLGILSQDTNLRGAFFTGEPFISATEKTFYAYSFYLPKSVAAIAQQQSLVLVGAIKDGTGSIVSTFRDPVKPASYDASGDRYADGSVELGPGKYTGSFAIYTADGATMLANAKTDFEVPEIATTRVSRPLLTARMDTLETQTAFDPFTFVAVKYPVKGSARFRQDESVGFFTFVANPVSTPAPSMAMRMKISKDGKVVHTTPLSAADLQQTGPKTYLLATRFQPKTFEPGRYQLELTLRDLNAPQSSEAYLTGYVRTVEFDVTD
jgi:GWxTD domain-containing protein